MYYGHDGMGMAWWWMLPMMFVFLVAVAAVLWAVLRPNQTPQTSQTSGPEDVLAHRLARGEIDINEYHERLAALRSPH